MTLWYWRYSLTPRARLSAVARPGAREGALIRAGDGVADVHPWPELGDLPLDEQLARLARGETTVLTKCSLRFASIDGAARRESRRLFDGLTIPLSHWTGNDPADGFDTIKIKGVMPVPPNVRVRIDFNATLTAEEFLSLVPSLPPVDFIEDPCAYDPPTWRMLRERTRLRFALDRGVASEGVDVLVYKPAVQFEWPDSDREIVVTSYMDHPFGQLGAAYVAATHRTSDRCGLMTHLLYEPNEFSELLSRDGARLVPPHGTGFGFDELLERLPWKRLT
jgi:O-succinylbenzoate synthase